MAASARHVLVAGSLLLPPLLEFVTEAPFFLPKGVGDGFGGRAVLQLVTYFFSGFSFLDLPPKLIHRLHSL